jgi:O-acetylserine/cysteine efflux transporter
MKFLSRLSGTRSIAIAEALLAIFIWASSFIFVKVLLPEIGPLLMCGLQYFLAFLILSPFILRQERELSSIRPKLWGQFAIIGVAAYTIGNGALYWAVEYLDVTTISFLMNLSPLVVMFAGIVFLREYPSRWQIGGVVISLVGGLLFFSPGLATQGARGFVLVMLGLLGFVAFGIFSRAIARSQEVSTLDLTAFPLAFGGGLLLIIGLMVESKPVLSLNGWFIIIWLASVNTAFAYFIYNHALKTITALEMNVFFNLSPLVTALFAWLFLTQTISPLQILGVLIVIAGVTIVQIQGVRKEANLHAA